MTYDLAPVQVILPEDQMLAVTSGFLNFIISLCNNNNNKTYMDKSNHIMPA